MRRSSRTFAAFVLLPFLSQATGAASLPALIVLPPAVRLPPPARLPGAAKQAPRKSPSGPSWWESARVVFSYLHELARETPAPAPRGPVEMPTPPTAAPRDPEPLAAVVPVPAPAEAPRDRMLIAMAPGERVVGVGGGIEDDLSAPPPAMPARTFQPPFRDRRLGGAGVSARVSYMDPRGRVRGFSDGFVATFADGHKRFVAAAPPPAYRREFPIYYHGETIGIELEIVNRSGHALSGVRVTAVQETFRPVGGEGVRLSPPAELSVPGVLPAGGRAVVRWSARLLGPGEAAVNLEQTHVTVSAGSGDSSKLLLDEPQAGVIDPPGPGLL